MNDDDGTAQPDPGPRFPRPRRGRAGWRRRRASDCPEPRPSRWSGVVRSAHDRFHGRYRVAGQSAGARGIVGCGRDRPVFLHAARVAVGPDRSPEGLATPAPDDTASWGPAPAPEILWCWTRTGARRSSRPPKCGPHSHFVRPVRHHGRRFGRCGRPGRLSMHRQRGHWLRRAPARPRQPPSNLSACQSPFSASPARRSAAHAAAAGRRACA